MASVIYNSAEEAIRTMLEVFQASVEHNASRHAWMPLIRSRSTTIRVATT